MVQIWNGDKNPGIIAPAEAEIPGLALDAADVPYPTFHHTYHLKDVSVAVEEGEPGEPAPKGGGSALKLTTFRRGLFRINSVRQDFSGKAEKEGSFRIGVGSKPGKTDIGEAVEVKVEARAATDTVRPVAGGAFAGGGNPPSEGGNPVPPEGEKPPEEAPKQIVLDGRETPISLNLTVSGGGEPSTVTVSGKVIIEGVLLDNGDPGIAPY